MTRLTDFIDAVNALTDAATKAAEGKGFTEAYINLASNTARLVQSELGEGDNPSADPITLTDPLE